MRVFPRIIALCGLVVVTSTGARAETASLRYAGRIAVDSEVRTGELDLLRSDLEFLDSLPGGRERHRWLEERVKFIANGDLDLDRPDATRELQRAKYPFADEGRYAEAPPDSAGGGLMDSSILVLPSAAAQNTGAVLTTELARNVGALVYGLGKDKGKLLSVRLPGVGFLKVTSPRVGIIELHHSLFWSEFDSIGYWDLYSRPMHVFRLAVLFHEARHDDGHGLSLGFDHAYCPKGHPYALTASCDRNLNGPYSIEAEFIAYARASVRDWTRAENAALERFAANVGVRVLRTTPGSSPVVDTMAREIAWSIGTCASFRTIGKAPDSCEGRGFEHLEAALATWLTDHAKAPPVSSTNWAAEPEQLELTKDK